MLIVLLPVFLAVVCVLAASRMLTSTGDGRPAQRTKVADTNPDHYPFAVTLEVSGLSGPESAARVQDTLNRMEGTWADQASAEDGTVHVRTKNRPDDAALKQTLAGQGCIVLHVRRED